MDKIKTVKIKNPDGSVSEETYTISVDAKDVDMKNGKDLQDTIGDINVDRDGSIAEQLGKYKDYDSDIETLYADVDNLEAKDTDLENDIIDLQVNKINKTDIIDNLNSSSNTKVLSAKQGKVLGDAVTALEAENVKKKAYFFDTVADMKAANLKDGDYACTLGYYSTNDGGGAEYKIVNTASLTEYQETVGNLYATLIIGDYIKPEMLGAYGDGITDDSEYFTKLSTYLTNKTKTIRVLLDKNYKIFNKLSITGCSNVVIDGKGILNKYISDYSANNTDIIYFYNTGKCTVKNIKIESHVVDKTIQTTRQSSYYAIYVASYDNNITDEVVIDNITYIDGYNVINSTSKPYNGCFVVSGYYSNVRPSNIKITNNTIINGCGRIIYCTHCKDIIIDNNNLINLGHNPNNFTATAGNVIFREITCNNVNISNNNVILSDSENYSFGETHVFELNTNDSVTHSGAINGYLASNNYIDMGNSGSASTTSVIRLECANNVNIISNIINCNSAKLINTRTVEEFNEWDKISIKNNIINADTNSLFSVSGTLNTDNSPIIFDSNNFNLNTTGNFITIDSTSYRYAGYRFINNYLKTTNYQGVASNSAGSKPQIVTNTNYYELTPSAVSDGVLTIPHNANYIRLITFTSAVTITNIVSSANDFDDGFVLNITSDLNGDNIKFSNALVLNASVITLEKYKGIRIIYNKANNRWYQI